MKRLQNKIAESGLALPVAVLYGFVIWLFSGLLIKNWWPQLICYAATIYLLAELSNGNTLLRIRSRIVSCSFIALSCMASMLFGSLTGGISQFFFVATILLLFTTYQNGQAVGRVFYAFVFWGGASMMHVQALWLLPVIWGLMLFQLQSFNWRTWMASIIGLLTPYWFLSLYFIYAQDFTPLTEHISGLWAVGTPFDYSSVSIGQFAIYLLTLALMLTGIIHFWHRSYEDKIRIRLLYGFFTYLGLLALLIVAVLPQYFDPFIRLAFICTSPLVGHFVALTYTRITNIAFIVITIVILLITVLNLWMPSFCF